MAAAAVAPGAKSMRWSILSVTQNRLHTTTWMGLLLAICRGLVDSRWMRQLHYEAIKADWEDTSPQPPRTMT